MSADACNGVGHHGRRIGIWLNYRDDRWQWSESNRARMASSGVALGSASSHPYASHTARSRSPCNLARRGISCRHRLMPPDRRRFPSSRDTTAAGNVLPLELSRIGVPLPLMRIPLPQ
jgi:hypothetical protein